jgi:hypothetical protein
MHHLGGKSRVERGDFFLDEILDRLDVVIGRRLQCLDPARVRN